MRLPIRTPASRAIVFWGTVAILYFARDILIPLAFAISLSFVLTPSVNALRRLRIGRIPATILSVAGSVVLLAGVAWIISGQLLDIASQLPLYRVNIHNKLDAVRLPSTGALGQAAASIRELADDFAPENAPQGNGANAAPNGVKQTSTKQPTPVQIVPQPENQLASLRNYLVPILKPLGEAGIVLIFAVFILIEREDLRNRLLRLAGIGRLNVMTKAIDDAAQRVSRYLLMQLLVNTCFGACFALSLYLIGVPNAPLWGLVAAILRIVPYAGTILAASLPVMLSLVMFDGWLRPLLVVVVFASLELVTTNFIEPTLYGIHTGISSLALLVSAIFWTAIWGPAGLILAIPLTVCLVVIGRYAPQLAFLHILLGDDPALPADAQFYQRLLAQDHEEARAIADRFMKERSLADLYDQVLLPAMGMAEQDRHRGALDAEREEFVYLNLSEMVAELAESIRTEESRPRKIGKTRVFCLPAWDQADEIAGAMLAQLLERNDLVALSFPAGPTADEMLAFVQPDADDLLCVSAVPPYAFTPARLMVKQLRARFPHTPLVVGVWGFSGDRERALARFEQGRPDRLFSTLEQVVAEALARDAEAGAVKVEPVVKVDPVRHGSGIAAEKA